MTTIGAVWDYPPGRAVRLTPRLAVNQVEAALDAARAGRGIVRALSYQVARDIAAGRLTRILEDAEPPPLPVHLLVPSARHMPSRVRVFLDMAARQLAALQEQVARLTAELEAERSVDHLVDAVDFAVDHHLAVGRRGLVGKLCRVLSARVADVLADQEAAE